MPQGHTEEWVPQVGERVHAYFYNAWDTATVRKVFSKGPDSLEGLYAEVLWDSEYSTSELPLIWLAKLPLPPSNAQPEASTSRPEDPAGASSAAAATPVSNIETPQRTVAFAPPPGLAGCNLLEATNSTAVAMSHHLHHPTHHPASQQGLWEVEVPVPQEPWAAPAPDAATSRAAPVRGQTNHPGVAPPVPPPNFAPMAPPTAPPNVAPEVLAAQMASRRKRSTGGEAGPSDQEIRNFVAKWQFQENTYTYLKGLPGPVLQAVLPGFKASADTECVDAMLNKYARKILERMSDGEVDIEAFVELWSLERPTADFLETMPLELKQQVIWGFHPKEAKPFDPQLRRFAQSIADNLKIPLRERSNSSMSTATTKATAGGATTPMTDREPVTSIPLPKQQSLQEELLNFIHKHQVKGVALQTLKALPPEQLKQVIDEFQPKNGPRDVDKALMQKINSVGKAQKEKATPSKVRTEDVKAVKVKAKAETKPSPSPFPAPPPESTQASVTSTPVMPKKAQEKWTNPGTTVPAVAATQMTRSPTVQTKAVTAVKAKANGFALLHESTTEDEEPEETRNAKTKKKEAEPTKSAKGKDVTKPSMPEPKAAVEEPEKKPKKKGAAEETRGSSKESAAQESAASEKKMPKKERKLPEKPEKEKPLPKLQAPSQDFMAPMDSSKAPKGANKMNPNLGHHHAEINEIPSSDLWEYDKMCLSTGEDAISIPKTKLGNRPIDAADFLRTEKELEMRDLLDDGPFQVDESRVLRDKKGRMIIPVDEECLRAYASDDSVSEDDMENEVAEDRRRMLRERATQRVGRTRRNQKMRLARRCPEPSKECKDPRCENCSKSESVK